MTGIRGIAAFLVVLYHYCGHPAFAGFHPPLLRKGYLCVDLFFVLSGFVLALRYGPKFESNADSAYGDFLKARFARIYPVYCFVLLLYCAKWAASMHFSSSPFLDVAANFTLVQSWGIPTHAIVTDSWSVSVEWFAYLLFPLLLVLATSRISIPILTSAAVASLIFIARSGYGVNGPLDAFRDDGALFPLLRCLAEFSLGLLAFRATQVSWGKKILADPATPGIILLFILAALFTDTSDVFIVLLFPLLIGSIYYNRAMSAAVFGNPLSHHLGEISYSLYLTHLMFVSEAAHFEDMVKAYFGPVGWFPFLLLGVALTWIAAYLSYRFIEVPCRKALAPKPKQVFLLSERESPIIQTYSRLGRQR